MLLLRIFQAANLAMLALMVGTATFVLAICGPVARGEGRAARAAKECRSRLGRIWSLTYVASVPAFLLWFFAECVMMTGGPLHEALSPATLQTVFQSTEFGRQCAFHFCLIAAVAVCIAGHRMAVGHPSPFLIGAAFIASIVLLGHMSCFSHAAAMSGARRVPFLANYATHLVATGIWLGGFLPLLIVLVKAHRSHDESWIAFAWEAARRFSPWGIASVAALLATGTISAYFLVGRIPALIGTAYGRLLVAKVILFLLMVGVAAVNKFWLTPALAAWPATRPISSAGPIPLLLRNVLIEAAAGILVLAIAVTLASMPTAVETYAG